MRTPCSAPLASLAALAMMSILSGCSAAAAKREALKEVTLAAVTSDSLTTALEDSLSGANDPANAFVGDLDACTDRVAAQGWRTVSTYYFEGEIPADFTATSSSSWRSRDGAYLAVNGGSSSFYGAGPDGSECESVVFGGSVKVALARDGAGYRINASYTGSNGQGFSVNAGARQPGRAAALLHVIRGARILSQPVREY